MIWLATSPFGFILFFCVGCLVIYLVRSWWRQR